MFLKRPIKKLNMLIIKRDTHLIIGHSKPRLEIVVGENPQFVPIGDSIFFATANYYMICIIIIEIL
jgi:hypothetical protein